MINVRRILGVLAIGNFIFARDRSNFLVSAGEADKGRMELRDKTRELLDRIVFRVNGDKQYLLCVHCHNPHDPKFKPLKPLPPPERPGNVLH